jgi:hypothetical protein
MDTDIDLHRGGESKLFLKSETEKIIGFAFDVFKNARLEFERVIL